MIKYIRMGKEGEGALQTQVESTLDNMSSSWHIERRTSEFQDIRAKAQELYRDLAKRRRDPKIRQAPFTEMTYDAAHNLAGALAYLLDEPLLVGKIGIGPGGGGSESGNSSATRELFVDQITDALNYLGLDGDAVKEALKRSGDIS